MRMLLPVLAVLASIITGFAQSTANKEEWNKPEYREVQNLAKQYVDKLVAKDYVGAVAMLPPLKASTPGGKVISDEARAEELEKFCANHSNFGPCTGSELTKIYRHTDSAYPDDVIFYNVAYKYTYAEKPSGLGYTATVMRKDGTLSLADWR